MEKEAVCVGCTAACNAQQPAMHSSLQCTGGCDAQWLCGSMHSESFVGAPAFKISHDRRQHTGVKRREIHVKHALHLSDWAKDLGSDTLWSCLIAFKTCRILWKYP